MSKFNFCFLVFLSLLSSRLSADDIVTLSGKKYFDVHDVLIRDNLLTFSTATDIIRIPLTEISPAIQQRYRAKVATVPVETTPTTEQRVSPKEASAPTDTLKEESKSPHELVLSVANKNIQQIGADMKTIRGTKPLIITAQNAFAVNQMEEARKAALISGRALVFFIVDEAFLGLPVDPNVASPAGAFAQFFQTFNNSTTIVLTVLPRDQASLPKVVSEFLNKPSTVATPRLVFTNAELTESLHLLQLTNSNASLEDREELIYSAVMALRKWYIAVANSVS